MIIKLNRYSKKGEGPFPWLINSDSIESVNDTRQGTVVILKFNTEPIYVGESVEEIYARIKGEAYIVKVKPKWHGYDKPQSMGKYLCIVQYVTPKKKYTRGKDHVNREYAIKSFTDKWNCAEDSESRKSETVIRWMELPEEPDNL